MKKEEKLLKSTKEELAKEAISLMEEVDNICSIFGEPMASKYILSNDFNSIEFKDYRSTNQSISISVAEISIPLKEELYGWGPCVGGLGHAIGYEKDQTESETELKNIEDIEDRVIEIHKELQSIEQEFLKLK